MKNPIPWAEPLSELMTAIDSFFFFFMTLSIFVLVLFYNKQTVICGKLWFIGRQLLYNQNNNVCCRVTVLQLVQVKVTPVTKIMNVRCLINDMHVKIIVLIMYMQENLCYYV